MRGEVSLMGDSVRLTTSVVGVVMGVVSGRGVVRASPASIFGMMREAEIGFWVDGGLGIGTLAASAKTPTAAVMVVVVGGSGAGAVALGTFFFFFLMMG